ncbi:hypothetical protein DFS33DRAFT_1453591 [Desarmillaria ectypa]|nr:hypothetical protein DFS33DRAFT_1453591 [Desarmillaria ectypa]
MGLPAPFLSLTCTCHNVTLCGSILVSASPVEGGDRELAAWLDLAPTIFVSLGMHVILDEKDTHQLAMGLRILLDRERKVQVIWKLKAQNSDVEASLHDIFGADMESGRVKVVDLLDIEPLALLMHHKLVCVVGHGRANSFFEAIHAGVLQVVLSAWYECYARIEWLGEGIYGNKNTTSGIETVELGRALTRIVAMEMKPTLLICGQRTWGGHAEPEGDKIWNQRYDRKAVALENKKFRTSNLLSLPHPLLPSSAKSERSIWN